MANAQLAVVKLIWDIILGKTEGVSKDVYKRQVRFRVGKVFQNCYISVYLNGDRILHRKKRIMAPGEMEEVQLERQRLLEYQGLKAITVRIEEE